MCDPLVGGLIAGAASIASGAAQQSANEDLANTQKQANDQWVAYQNQIHQQQVAAEDTAREKANAAREDTLAKVTPQAQTQSQITEQQRLNTLEQNPAAGKTTTDPNDPASLALSGQEKTGNFMDSLTTQVNQATSQARNRIAALATVGSYGGSFGGLGTTVPIAFAQGGNQIQLQNDIRQGNLKTYGVEQQVQPLQYALTGGNMMGSIANALGGIAGKGLGTAAAGAWGGASGGGGGSVMDPLSGQTLSYTGSMPSFS